LQRPSSSWRQLQGEGQVRANRRHEDLHHRPLQRFPCHPRRLRHLRLLPPNPPGRRHPRPRQQRKARPRHHARLLRRQA
ncbi:hypothetical protein LTS18_010495, partial [Coniosporium uncinatum]